MQLGDILDDVALDVATSSLEITRVEIDSRESIPGTLFFALPGANQHGKNFANEAVRRGAVCVVSDVAIDLSVPVVVVPATQLKGLLAHASATLVQHPESRAKLIGVTGTNGKTSVTTIVAALARALRWNGASVGTLTGARTTPAAPELYRTLAAIVEDFDAAIPDALIAMEVSSHALDQRRIEGLRFCVAAFTNLSHDHLDYHHSMEEYFSAKSVLFTSEFAKRAVIWVDDEYGERLASTTTLPVTRVSRADASDVMTSLTGSTYFWRGHLVNTPLVGDYNVDNALLAMSIMSVLGSDDASIAAAMGEAHSIPGRFDVLYGRGITVIVDYAHTPEGLQRLLRDVRALAPHASLRTVFGAGGDRDRTKRPAMGEVVSRASDFTIVTSDNPRSEDPDAIIEVVMSGVVPGSLVEREVDRRRAIARAIEGAAPGDVVILAGKGHETTLTVGELEMPFDDRVVAMEFLK